MNTQYGVNTRSLNNLLEDVLADTNYIFKNGIKKVTKQPPVNIIENQEAYELSIMVAGIAKEQIQIETKQKALIVSYKPEEQNATDGQTVLRKEFAIEGFERKFSLDDKMDVENIRAKYENGILQIAIPKLIAKESTEKVIRID